MIKNRNILYCHNCGESYHKYDLGEDRSKIPSTFPFCSQRCSYVDLDKYLSPKDNIEIEKEVDED